MKLGGVRSEISRRGENARWVRVRSLVIIPAYELIAEPHDRINIESSSSLPTMTKGGRNTKRKE